MNTSSHTTNWKHKYSSLKYLYFSFIKQLKIQKHLSRNTGYPQQKPQSTAIITSLLSNKLTLLTYIKRQLNTLNGNKSE